MCEARALCFGRRLLAEQFGNVQDVMQGAEKQRQDGKKPCFELSNGTTDRIESQSVVTDVEQ